MRRKLFLQIAFMALISLQAYAQDESKTNSTKEKSYTYSMKEMWYVSIGGGPNLLMSNQDGKQSVSDRLHYGGEFSVGRWFNPGFGARLQVYAGKYRGFNYLDPQKGTFTEHGDGKDAQYYPRDWVIVEHGSVDDVIAANKSKYKFTEDKLGFWQDFTSTTLFLDFTVNITGLARGYNLEPGQFNAIGFIGVGYAHNIKSETNPTTDVAGVRFGGRVSYDLQKNSPWSVYFEGNGTFFPERYDGYVGDQGYDSNANAMIGLQYKF